MKISLTFSGDQKMAETLKSKRERMQAAARAALYEAGNAVMTNAKQRAPMDLGTLRASGYVAMPTTGSHPKVELGFGGAAKAYALAQHEHTEYRHEVGEAKFLEHAFHDVDVKGIIQKRLKEGLEGKGAAPQLSQGQHRTEPE